jgi:hypothetical protein
MNSDTKLYQLIKELISLNLDILYYNLIDVSVLTTYFYKKIIKLIFPIEE